MEKEEHKPKKSKKNRNNQKLVAVAVVVGIIIVGGLVASLLFILLNSRATDPVAFNNKIVSEQSTIIEKIQDLGKAFNDGKSKDEAISKHQVALDQAKAALVNIQELEAPEDGKEMKAKAEELFSFYVTILDEDYRELINLIFSDNITSTQGQKVFDIIGDVSEKEEKLDSEFSKIQHDFAERNNFELNVNPLQNEIDQNSTSITTTTPTGV